jgi:Rrf2 family nitric oxide-sensitive transcriptional repressor
MYLTRQADYTMRLLIHLAVQPSGVATIKEIAGHYGISRNHLMKVANRAAQAGYVEGVRGRAGGLKLAKRAKEINVGQRTGHSSNVSNLRRTGALLPAAAVYKSS